MFAHFLPIPGSLISSSNLSGTLPLYFFRIILEVSTIHFPLLLHRPTFKLFRKFCISSTLALAMLSMVGYLLKSSSETLSVTSSLFLWEIIHLIRVLYGSPET
ncbi:102aa long hypothetical protein [Pyrococcus horikoshii OT3]|uniref:Uncharacterized protein n=1 Tax=Pyrococcus horikoshii (strain ATCC 700860 / DSM 12428 / JCM 9974 / NBRC 100139 / OT-3) TaxID=70601 RepID=O59168_PYRHO|nr:102aa long hypothetical protein [Pyrococcus horikoshii OT3]